MTPDARLTIFRRTQNDHVWHNPSQHTAEKKFPGHETFLTRSRLAESQFQIQRPLLFLIFLVSTRATVQLPPSLPDLKIAPDGVHISNVLCHIAIRQIDVWGIGYDQVKGL
jgi:hypothetical protein